MVSSRISTLIAIVITIAFAVSSCGFTQTAPVADSGAVTISLSDGSAKPGGTSGALESATITGITLEISASDMTTINTTIPTGTLETSVDVPAGDSRTFTAIVTIAGQAFNGTTTEDVTAGSSLTVEIPITIDGTTYAIYTAGGTVSGLSGSVTLQLTSSAGSISNTKAVSSNGSFAFTADYFRTTWDYAVTVSADPTSPNQTCAVSSGSGSVNAGNVTNVSVACTTDKYKVGGSVSGLSGTVVLQNNSGDDLTLTADGSFSFATPIDDASTYSVTVLTNPSGQTCSVSSGSGTMNGAAVTSVSVTCSTSTYTIGGTVTGLTGSVGLYEGNNNDAVTITTNGLYTFGVSLPNGFTYDISVITQPSGQTCTVSNGTGTISGANVANVDVSCTASGTAGVTVSNISGSTTEAGGTATFTVVLDSLPTADVTMVVASDDVTEGIALPAILTFTSANWSNAQTVTVTGVPDLWGDGDIVYSVIINTASSSDTNYNGINPADVSGITNIDSETGRWTTKASMPTGRYALATAELNGKIYAVGGWDGSWSGVVEEYDLATDTWTNCGSGCTTMTTPRGYLTVSAVNGKIYAVGGTDGSSNALSTVEEFDPATNIWTNCGSSCTSMNTAHQSHPAAVVNGKIYIIAGIGPSGAIDVVEEYNPVTGQWTTITPLPSTRFGHTAAVVNGKIYSIGGYNGGDVATVEEYDPVADSWTNCGTGCTSMNVARRSLSSGTVNGKIYAMGGVGPLSVVEEYDPITNSWSDCLGSCGWMPSSRYAMDTASVNGKIYAIGGTSGSSQETTVEEFTPPAPASPDSWAAKTSMTTARIDSTSSVLNGKIYVIGGWDGSYLNGVEVYDTATDTWGAINSMTTARRVSTGSAVNGKIYVIGGLDGSYLNNVEVYDLETDTWTDCGSSCAAMTTARSGSTSSAVNGKIYVIGGLDGSFLTTVEEYDPATNTWTDCGGTCATMTTARYAATSSVVNGKIYVIGGEDAFSGSILNTVEEYDPATNTWTNCGGNCATMPTARIFASSGVVNGKIYVIGGDDGSNPITTVEEYDPATDTWAATTDMTTARFGHVGSVVNGKIYAIGGFNSGSYLNTVGEYTPPGL